jgi:transcriptional regulator with XRE-family HTH domain
MSTPQILAVNRLERKRSAVSEHLGHVSPVHKTKLQGLKTQLKTPIHEVFIRRVRQELERQGVSVNGLCQRVGGPKQTTLNDALRGSDPTLTTIFQTAFALGIAPAALLTEQTASASVQRVESSPQTAQIHALPTRYPPIFKKANNHNGKRTAKKKNRHD